MSHLTNPILPPCESCGQTYQRGQKEGYSPQLLDLEPAPRLLQSASGIMLGCFCSRSGDGEEVGALPEARDLHGTGHATMQGTVRLLPCIATRLPVTGCFAVSSLNLALWPAPASLLRSQGKGK